MAEGLAQYARVTAFRLDGAPIYSRYFTAGKVEVGAARICEPKRWEVALTSKERPVGALVSDPPPGELSERKFSHAQPIEVWLLRDGWDNYTTRHIDDGLCAEDVRHAELLGLAHVVSEAAACSSSDTALEPITYRVKIRCDAGGAWDTLCIRRGTIFLYALKLQARPEETRQRELFPAEGAAQPPPSADRAQPADDGQEGCAADATEDGCDDDDSDDDSDAAGDGIITFDCDLQPDGQIVLTQVTTTPDQAPAACDDGDPCTTDAATTDGASAPPIAETCDDGDMCMKCGIAPIDAIDGTWCTACVAKLQAEVAARNQDERDWIANAAVTYLCTHQTVGDDKGKSATAVAIWMRQLSGAPAWMQNWSIGSLAKAIGDVLELDARFDVDHRQGGAGPALWVLSDDPEPAAATLPESDDPAPGSYAPPRPEHVDWGELTIDHIVWTLRDRYGSYAAYNMAGHIQQKFKVNATTAAIVSLAQAHPNRVVVSKPAVGPVRLALPEGEFECEVACLLRQKLGLDIDKGCSLTGLGAIVAAHYNLGSDATGRIWVDRALLAQPEWFLRTPGKPVRLRAG